jgi:hypothetical protein
VFVFLGWVLRFGVVCVCVFVVVVFVCGVLGFCCCWFVGVGVFVVVLFGGVVFV